VQKKPASYLHRTAQPHTLAIFRSWGSSVGAGRIRLAGCKYKVYCLIEKSISKNLLITKF